MQLIVTLVPMAAESGLPEHEGTAVQAQAMLARTSPMAAEKGLERRF